MNNIVTDTLASMQVTPTWLADHMDVCRPTILYWRKCNRIPIDRVKDWCEITGQDPREVRPDVWDVFKDCA